jgi:hypothetical protein
MTDDPRPPADPREPSNEPEHREVEPGEVGEDPSPEVREAEREE